MKGIFNPPLVLSVLLSIFSNVAFAINPTASAQIDTLTLTWGAVDGAEQYRVEEKAPGGVWSELGTGNFLSYDISTTRADGDYDYRVVGCLVTPFGGVPKCAEVAEYSAPHTITFPFAAPNPLAPASVKIAGAPANVDAASFTNDPDSASVGTIAGEFRVDESGAATYQVPLTLPQGIAGVTPQVALSYSSAAGNGPLGVGWNISGLSAVTRCRPTNEQDATNRQLTLSNDDRFCLDGQKLIAVTGNYGEDGTEYRTEIDSRIRVISKGTQGNGPAYFTVEREDGTTSYYGGNNFASSRADATLLADTTGVVWSITTLHDNINHADNKIEFTYHNAQTDIADTGINEIVIDEIAYSGHKVVFNYKTSPNRQDVRSGFVLGAQVIPKAHLESIRVETKNANNPSPTATVTTRTYTLQYDTDVDRNVERIVGLTECGLNNTCLPQTTFNWYDQPARAVGGVLTRTLGSDEIHSPMPFDVDGDGYTDFAFVKKATAVDAYDVYVAYNYGSGTLGEPTKIFTIINDQVNTAPIKIIPSDLDGDGRVELAYYTKVGSELRWKYYDFNDTNTVEIQNCWNSANCSVTYSATHIVDIGLTVNMGTTSKNEILFHDFNGDAYPDIVLPTSRILNDGTGHFPGPAIQTNLIFASARAQEKVYQSSLTASNEGEAYDGEIMTLAEALELYAEVEISTSDNKEGGVASNQEQCVQGGTVIADTNTAKTLPSNVPAMDFNGDGVGDLVVRMINIKEVFVGQEQVQCPGDMFWSVYTLEKVKDSNGNYGSEPKYVKLHWYPKHKTLDSTIYAGDFNGDGLADLLHPPADNVGTGFNISYSTGSGMTGLTPVTLGAAVEDSTSIQVMDVDKDGRADILYFDKVQKRWEVNYQQSTGGFTTGTVLRDETNFDETTDAAMLADWNADGDFGFARLEFDNKTLLYRNDNMSNFPANRIHKITNGFGLKTDIEYALMTDSSVYEKGAGADTYDNWGNGSPVFDVIAPQHLVKTVTSDAPGYVGGSYSATNRMSVDYFYEAMRAQSGGRGSLGFAKLYTYDPQRQITTETEYHQEFPFTGMPKSTKQYMGQKTASPAVNTLLSQANNSYAQIALNGGKTVFPYLDKSEETSYAVNDAGTATQFMRKVITDNNYGITGSLQSHANLNSVDVLTKESNDSSLTSYVSKVTTNNTFGVDYGVSGETKWWLGRVTNTSVTHQRVGSDTHGNLSVTRSSSFEYDLSNGLLTKETVSTPTGMNAAQSELTTLHCYDEYGNKDETYTFNNDFTNIQCDMAHSAIKALVTVDGNQKVFRYQNTSFDGGRYVTDTSDALFKNVTVINDRNDRGMPVKATDINNVVTRNWFDDFGRAYASANSLGQETETIRRLMTNTTGIGTLPPIGEVHAHFVEKTTTSGAPTQFKYYDVMGRQVAQATQGFDGLSYIVQTSKYDLYGQVISQSNPHYTSDMAYFTTSVYDKFGRVESIAAADGTNSTVTYSNDGFTTSTSVTFDSVTQGNQIQSKTETKNVLGQTVTINDEAGFINYRYDATGNLTKVIGVDNVEIVTSFDKLGRKTGMIDPDKGTWSYQYNALGELTSQTDARGHITTFYRDAVGRTLERQVSGNGVTESTNYDFGISHLLQSEYFTGTNALTKQYFYDGFGRANLVRSSLDNGKTYAMQTTYDEFGRVFQQFDADESSLEGCLSSTNTVVGVCLGVQNNYNNLGYLESQEEARYGNNTADADRDVFQEVTAMDAFGNVTSFKQNDAKITSNRVYDQQTGYIKDIQASNGVLIQDNDYQFDAIGNLRSRTRHALATTASLTIDSNSRSIQSESFQYDNVNRLTHIDNVEFMQYQANGNIHWKKGVGNYCYNSARPHAVSGIGSANCITQDYQYDANGNMTSGRGRTLTYAHYDKPTSIANTAGTTDFAYDTGRKRYKRVTTENGKTTTTYYIGNTEVVEVSDGTSEVRRYLPNAIQTHFSTGAIKTRYLHKDHLGSINTITDDDGKILEKVYFDVWGKRMSIDSLQWNTVAQSQAASTLVSVLDITPRGFTGHEHVDHADIIHMNGRIYDPTLGRFLQADPHVQAPQNSQSLNRYSYVLNNPLSYTDPSGYFFKSLFKFVKKYWRVIASIVVAVYLPGAAGFWSSIGVSSANTIAVGAITGFISGGIATGSLKGALVGAFTGGMFGKLHGMASGFSKVVAHGVVGGIGSVLNGGKFGHGFLSAGFTQASGNVKGLFVEGAKGLARLGNAVKAAIIGGTASVISGGKFASGAITGAFSRLLNDDANNSIWDDANEAFQNDDTKWIGAKASLKQTTKIGNTTITSEGTEIDLLTGEVKAVKPEIAVDVVDMKKMKITLKTDQSGNVDGEISASAFPGGPEVKLDKDGLSYSQDIPVGTKTANGTLTVNPLLPHQKVFNWINALQESVSQATVDANTGRQE